MASDGTVTPVAAGTTNIVVTDGTKRAICIVRVTGSGTSGTTSSGGGTTTTPSTPEPSIPGGESHEGYGPAPKPTPEPEPAPDPAPPNEPEEPGNADPNGGGGLFDDLWGIAA